MASLPLVAHWTLSQFSDMVVQVKNPEQSIQEAVDAAEQFMMVPLAFGEQESEFDADAARHLAAQRLAKQGARFVQLSSDLTRLLTPAGEYPDTIRHGGYERMTRLAQNRGATAAELVARYRNQENLTITDAFAVHGLMSFVADVNRPPISQVPHSGDRATYYLTHFSGTLAKHVSEEDLRTSPDPFDISVGLNNIGDRLGKALRTEPQWVTQKFYTLAEHLNIRKHHTRLIEAETAAEVDDISELKRNNDALFKELNRLRCYSIKSALHQDGEAAWSIHDGFDYQAHRTALAEGSDIDLSSWPPNLRLIALEQLEHTDRLYTAGITVEQQKINRQGLGRAIFMDDKGSIFADHNGIFGYEDLYAKAGKPQNYEVLRQKMLRYFFDLTVPTDVVRQVISDERRVLGEDAHHNDQRDPQQVIYADILLPRIRRLKSFRTIGQMERFETATPQHESAKRKLELPLHPVEAHRRMLPPGYAPSQQALELAQKLGIELEPGETVVAKHSRGHAKNGVVIHGAKKRKRQ